MKRRSHRRARRTRRHSGEMALAHMRASEAGFLSNPIMFDGDGDPALPNPLGETLIVVALLGVAGFGAYYWYTHRAVTVNLLAGQSSTTSVNLGQTVVVNAPAGSWILTPAALSTAATNAPNPLTMTASTTTSATYSASAVGSSIVTATSTDGTQTATVSIVVS